MASAITTNRWLGLGKPNPQAKLRLFCFPYAGGGSLIFRRWGEGLPESVEVCSVQLPGREMRLREMAFTRMMPLVQAIAEAMLPYFDKPFAFFGHSMGATISFELARHLRREYSLQPEQLFVSGRSAPQIPNTDPPTYHLPEERFIEELRRLSGTPKEVLEHKELLGVLLPLLRADFELIQTYQYTVEPPLDCPISAFGGLQDEEVGRNILESWKEQTTVSFALHMFPGNHFFLHSSQSLLLRILGQETAKLVEKIDEKQQY
jgi:medium-chain acyl-[acyl-carrier-protein] hydrolase